MINNNFKKILKCLFTYTNTNINATLKFTGNCNCSLSSNSAFITNELSALSPSVYNTINKNNHRYTYNGTEWIKVV